MNGFKKIFYPLLLLLLSASIAPAYAQMTDDQVVEYVKSGLSAGKGEAQIGQELLARGVTQSQMERLKTKYEESQGSDASPVDQSVAGQQTERLRNAADEMGAGSLDAVNAVVNDPTRSDSSGRNIFGHNVFTGRALTFEPNENLATPANYKLGPGDEVIINIWGANEDNLRQTISPEGNIMVSQIGPVYLNGLTIQEANDKLRGIFARKYAGVLGEDPVSEVRVTLGQNRTIQVNVMGEVATPGTYRLSSFSSVFHALYKAGGVTNIGSLRNIRVMRGGKTLVTIDLYKYLFDGRLSDDVRLEEGDVILVPTYGLLVGVEGNVKRPMYYEMKKGETLAKLFEYAGGFTGNAYADEVRLIRETGRERQLFNIPSSQFASYKLEDGDAVTVGATLDRFANRIEVRGAVYRPGMYELGEGTSTVRELIERADGLMDDAFLSRVQLFRETQDLSLEVLPIDLKGVMEGRLPDVALRKNDVLVIPSIHELQERGAFTVNGQVARPGVYPYAENTTLEDLIIQAGGLLEGASTVKVDVSRRLKDPKSTIPSNEIGKVYTFSLKDGFVIDGDPGFILEPFDVVEVRRSPGYQPQRQVSILGEVAFPGGYTLIRKNERLSDLIERAGGITNDAYVRGGRLIRRMTDEERAVRDAVLRTVTQNQESDSVAVGKLNLSDFYSVGIELDKALANPGSDYDVVLREGDRLVVPEHVSTVRIQGEVMYPNTVVYIEGQPLKYYISQAGGYGQRAKRNRAYVVYMNGTVARVKSNVIIEPGCEIIVPSKRAREKLSIGEIMGLTTSAASVGTMAATIANLFK